MFGVTTELPKLGDLIREYRHKANLTQQDLARKAGVSAATISRWERGTVEKIDIQQLLRVAGLIELPRLELNRALEETSPAALDAEAVFEVPLDDMQVNLKTIGTHAPNLPPEDREAVARIIIMAKEYVERVRAAQRRRERQQLHASNPQLDASEPSAEED